MGKMPYLYSLKKLEIPFEEAWGDFQEYWANQNVKEFRTQIQNQGFTRIIEFKTKPNLHFYAFSFGEKYRFTLHAFSETNEVYMLIKVKYSLFAGRGFIWKVPQSFVDEFMEELGLEPTKLKSKIPFKYQKIQERVQTINTLQH